MRQFNFRLAYIDLLLNFMVGLVFISIMSQPIQKKSKTEEEGIKKNAEMVIQVDWNKELDCDVDMWVRDPIGNVVYFGQRDKGVMHIERDDLGFRNDLISVAKEFVTGQKTENNLNQEVWVLRGKVPGEFTFNLHLYSCKIGEKQYNIGEELSLPVEVTMIKVNPDYMILYKETITFTKMWQEKTVLNFTLDKDGNMEDKNTLSVQLVKVKQ